ncbi:hypothetical protein ACFPVX_07380 [Cohnella faecalis]|uniref:Uncharacterized protein n=1 Tax=Cohnella faecalis TaxID=2315694 RepID=A0A398CMA3_9BACL|nr:hypothetical protein [Cohnella faecalis]RIE00771.1 hypothetical protein D3H35_26630 [Cohnella faecalis]
MSLTAKQIAGNWVNDQLDLYNFAVQLGDAEWQRQILDRLQDRERLIRLEAEHLARLQLWQRFDEINRKILHIYDELRMNASAEVQQKLREKAWELKMERTLIGKKIQVSSSPLGEMRGISF